MVVLNGGSDPQVLADKDTSALSRALMQRDKLNAVHIMGGVSHTLKPTPSMEANAHEGAVSPDILKVLEGWVRDLGWG